MKISFVIPAFNEEKYLGNCLDSIIAATKDKNIEMEIIVVNNASTDGTRAVAESKPGVRIVDEPQKGLSRARQSGFAVSTGELVANLDADTMLPAAWINFVIRDFDRNQKLVGLSGPHILYGVPRLVSYWATIFYYAGYLTYFMNRHILNITSVLQGGNFVVRRSALEKIGGFNPEFTFYGEDADLVKRLHKVGQVNFTLSLPILASGRRVMAEGKFTMAWRYFMNYAWTTFFGRPFNSTSRDIR